MDTRFSKTVHSSVMSKKIHKQNLNKMKAFIISLLLHSTLTAAVFYFASTKRVVEPSQAKEKRVVVSLVALSSNSVPKEAVVQKKQLIQKEIKQIVKPKPIVKKAEPIVQKAKPIVQTKLPKKSLLEENKTEQTSQKEPILKKDTLPLSKVLEPKVAQQEPKQELHSTKETLVHQEREQPSNKSQEISHEQLSKIRSLIQNSLVYPSMARRLKIEGTVVVSFVLNANGHVEGANIVTQSGSASLDKKALKTVLALSGAYPHLNRKIDLKIPISFSLKNS